MTIRAILFYLWSSRHHCRTATTLRAPSIKLLSNQMRVDILSRLNIPRTSSLIRWGILTMWTRAYCRARRRPWSGGELKIEIKPNRWFDQYIFLIKLGGSDYVGNHLLGLILGSPGCCGGCFSFRGGGAYVGSSSKSVSLFRSHQDSATNLPLPLAATLRDFFGAMLRVEEELVQI